MINAGTQPLQNLAVMQKLGMEYATEKSDQLKWSRHWIEKGLLAYEKLIKDIAGTYSFSDTITSADLFLIPQIYNAQRFKVELDQYPLIQKINKNCLKLEAFQSASPECQLDTPQGP